MKLENQVCTLSQAKKLKELGVKQCAFFSWFGDEEQRLMDNGKEGLFISNWLFVSSTEPYNNQESDWRNDVSLKQIASAFTVAELGQMLPDNVLADFEFDEKTLNYISGQYDCRLEIWKVKSSITGYGIAYRKNNNPNIQLPKSEQAFFKEHEAEVRAEMLIYLLENGHINVTELNSSE